MRVRTIEELSRFVDGEFSTRRREIFLFKSQIETTRTDTQEALIRVGVVLIYAHWEGFIKQSATAYLYYVESKRLKYADLSDNLIATALIPLVNKAANESNFENLLSIKDMFTNLNSRWCAPVKQLIETESNLNSKVLKKIVNSLGSDYSIYSLKEKFIDEKLLHRRNMISHGGYIATDIDDFKLIENQTIEIMDKFRDQIHESIKNRRYLCK